MAKQKAIAQIYGDWEESYNKVPKLLQALQSYFLGTICELWVVPYYDGHLLVHDLAQGGNSNILPISFAIVEFESTESWLFFITNLRRHVTPQEGLLVISDRSQAIKAALNADDSGWHPPRAFHAYCIRHMAANFITHFKSTEGKQYLINATYSPRKGGYEWYMDALRGLSPGMVNWAGHFNPEIWLQHYDSGWRFGHMTTNLSKCINAVFKGIRYLPISSIVRITYERLQKLFVTKGREAQSQLAAGNRFSQRLMAAIEKNREGIPNMRVTHCDRQASALHYPCRHALARCAVASIEWAPYVHPVYRQEDVFKVYEMEFSPTPDESLGSEWDGTLLRPNPLMCKKATKRPVSSKFWNDMDEVERQEKQCGLCMQVDHTRKGCPNKSTNDA
ncbi:uncharacterized protein LOC107635974 [Arachis ipaensis]|uniref:uncharacterized protein LOC107635974 n=1 Tax=Arachis ipaensis TaxID=130454 RepID=UPI0007AF5924|nr:uncharacterized protein LOC107635974 [Arachis ipaensis]XP_025647215.1 uncharacterized protein LOC112742186 [Arachis hypogaea]